jgi:hypothetical protein
MTTVPQLRRPAFEFGFGHYVAGASWSTLVRDWDITQAGSGAWRC